MLLNILEFQKPFWDDNFRIEVVTIAGVTIDYRDGPIVLKDGQKLVAEFIPAKDKAFIRVAIEEIKP